MCKLWITTIFLLLLLNGYNCIDDPSESVSTLRGQPLALTCPLDVTSCGELHSVKWFKGNERVAVVSGDGEVANIEGDYAARMSIDHSPAGPATRLHIKSVQVFDEDIYLCESTYLEPSDACESTGSYSIEVKVLVSPSSILILDEENNQLKNATTLGPLREGHTLGGTCEVRGSRPAPTVGWYRAGKRLTDSVTVDEANGLFNVKSVLSLALTRHELGSFIECRVETPALEHVVSNQLYLDLQVRPTKIALSGVKHHTVQGTKVLLQCQVIGARPAANVTWYNTSRIIEQDTEGLSTKTYLQNDGTFETTSQFIFSATRYENGATIRCEADNVVMRDDLEKPLHDTLVLEVMYPPVVVVKPENVTVNETADFLLFCEYESNPATLEHVKWLKSGQPLNLNQSRYEGGNPEQTALLVKNATRDDIGLYKCELSNSIGTDVSDNEVTVDVQYVPIVEIFMEPESPIIENNESNVTLYCNVEQGNPSQLLKVRWFLDGQILKELPECEDSTADDEGDNLCDIDPSKMLLQNVGRDFLGNYSCEGYNLAGWGERSKESQLIVYYEPGNATLQHYPPVPIKKKSVTFTCSVDDGGNPNATRYRWLRGGKPVMDVVTPIWTVDPVGLDSRTNFSCYAYNEGGDGVPATIQLDVHAPPAFIQKLPPYTGALYSTPGIALSCRVECIPLCTIAWFKDGIGIEENNDRYYIRESVLPADPATGDFESVLSVLNFNMSAWPEEKFDVYKDNANYSCVSSNNSIGVGVRSATYFGVEYPPENTTVSNLEVRVEESLIPQRVLCQAKAYPEPTYEWRRLGEVIAKGNALIVNKAMQRSDSGSYTCMAFNKHGNHSTDTFMNVLYKPNCTIQRKEIENEDTLICTAFGNPEEVDFVWSLKSENDTVESWNTREEGSTSYLFLDDDFTVMRTYRCIANNSVGAGLFCEIDVAGHLAWWQRWDRMTLIFLVAAVAALLLTVIIVCIIIICICRKRRRQDKYHTDVSNSATQSVLSSSLRNEHESILSKRIRSSVIESTFQPATSAYNNNNNNKNKKSLIHTAKMVVVTPSPVAPPRPPPPCEIPKSPPKWTLRPGVMVHVKCDNKLNLSNTSTMQNCSYAITQSNDNNAGDERGVLYNSLKQQDKQKQKQNHATSTPNVSDLQMNVSYASPIINQNLSISTNNHLDETDTKQQLPPALPSRNKSNIDDNTTNSSTIQKNPLPLVRKKQKQQQKHKIKQINGKMYKNSDEMAGIRMSNSYNDNDEDAQLDEIEFVIEEDNDGDNDDVDEDDVHATNDEANGENNNNNKNKNKNTKQHQQQHQHSGGTFILQIDETNNVRCSNGGSYNNDELINFTSSGLIERILGRLRWRRRHNNNNVEESNDTDGALDDIVIVDGTNTNNGKTLNNCNNNKSRQMKKDVTMQVTPQLIARKAAVLTTSTPTPTTVTVTSRSSTSGVNSLFSGSKQRAVNILKATGWFGGVIKPSISVTSSTRSTSGLFGTNSSRRRRNHGSGIGGINSIRRHHHHLNDIKCSTDGVVTYKRKPKLTEQQSQQQHPQKEQKQQQDDLIINNNNNNTEDTITRKRKKMMKNDLIKLSSDTHNVITSKQQQSHIENNESLPDKSSVAGDPLTEPGEYENLPFHGLQSAPNKPYLTTTKKSTSFGVGGKKIPQKMSSIGLPLTVATTRGGLLTNNGGNYGIATTNCSNIVRVAPRQKLSEQQRQQLQQQQQQQQQHQQQHTNSNNNNNNFPSSFPSSFYPNNSNFPPNHFNLNTFLNCMNNHNDFYVNNDKQQQQQTNIDDNQCNNDITLKNPFIVKHKNNRNNSSIFSCNQRGPVKTVTTTTSTLINNHKSMINDKKFNSLKSLGIKKSPQFYSMRVNKCRRHQQHHPQQQQQQIINETHLEQQQQQQQQHQQQCLSVVGTATSASQLLTYDQPLYENLTDSIQIHELIGIDEHNSIYRSDSGISNSSYECITPIPAPRTGELNINYGKRKNHQHHHQQQHQQQKIKTHPVYMNLPCNKMNNGQSGSGNKINKHLTAFVGYERVTQSTPTLTASTTTNNSNPLITSTSSSSSSSRTRNPHKQQKQILVPKELFPQTTTIIETSPESVNNSNGTMIISSGGQQSISMSRRPVRLPLRKHHSFHFHTSQTTAAALKQQQLQLLQQQQHEQYDENDQLDLQQQQFYNSNNNNSNNINNNNSVNNLASTTSTSSSSSSSGNNNKKYLTRTNGPLVFKQFNETNAFRPITPVIKPQLSAVVTGATATTANLYNDVDIIDSDLNEDLGCSNRNAQEIDNDDDLILNMEKTMSLPRICGTSLKRHTSNVETMSEQQTLHQHRLQKGNQPNYTFDGTEIKQKDLIYAELVEDPLNVIKKSFNNKTGGGGGVGDNNKGGHYKNKGVNKQKKIKKLNDCVDSVDDLITTNVINVEESCLNDPNEMVIANINEEPSMVMCEKSQHVATGVDNNDKYNCQPSTDDVCSVNNSGNNSIITINNNNNNSNNINNNNNNNSNNNIKNVNSSNFSGNNNNINNKKRTPQYTTTIKFNEVNI